MKVDVYSQVDHKKFPSHLTNDGGPWAGVRGQLNEHHGRLLVPYVASGPEVECYLVLNTKRVFLVPEILISDIGILLGAAMNIYHRRHCKPVRIALVSRDLTR